MFVPPVNNSHKEPLLPVEEKKLSGLGYLWKKIKDIPSGIYALIIRISRAVASIFRKKSEATQDLSKKEVKVQNKPTSAEAVFHEVVVEQQKDKPTSAAASEPQKILLNYDPLTTMGAIGPVAGPKKSEDKIQREIINNSLPIEMTGMIEPALEIMKIEPDSLEMYNDLTQILITEHTQLKEKVSQLKNMPIVVEVFEKTIQSIEDKMAEWGNAVIQNAQGVLNDLSEKEPAELKDFFDFTQQVDTQFEALQPFASRFKELAPETHDLVQGIILALEQKKSELDADMCEQVRLSFHPNPAIPGAGNCLFESIKDQVGEGDQSHYRKLAVEYLRQHRDDFRDGIIDAMRRNPDVFREGIIKEMKSSQGENNLKSYLEAKGMTVLEWKEDLKKALNTKINPELEDSELKDPDLIDYYFDCMEYYPHLGAPKSISNPLIEYYFTSMENSPIWGGFNEITALSEVLKTPILVFTLHDNGENWRFDLGRGQTYNKPPILLYYTGNHYQNLKSN